MKAEDYLKEKGMSNVGHYGLLITDPSKQKMHQIMEDYAKLYHKSKVEKLFLSDVIGRLIVKYKIILYQPNEYMIVNNETDLSVFRGTVIECTTWLILNCNQ